MKIDQLIFIRDLVIKKDLTDYNSNIILMKAGSAIKMTKPEDYKEVDLHIYQWLIGEQIYLFYSIKPDIAFVVELLSKHNSDPRKGHLQVAKRVV